MYSVHTENFRPVFPHPRAGNLMDYSMLRQIRGKVNFNCFAIKFAVEGCEKYVINGNTYLIKTGQYLLANQHAEGFAEIDSKTIVRGICIDLANDLLAEVVSSHLRPDSPISDFGLDKFFTTPNFLENQYNTRQTRTGALLERLAAEIGKNPFYPHQFSREFYFNLAENIVADHVPIFQQLQSIPSIRSETRKDLLRRVYRGKDFIDEHFVKSIEISTVAQQSQMSEYHFFRLFKMIFGASPYQYLLRKRLSLAAQKIQTGSFSLAEIGQSVGFSDIHAFSKAFKKQFGVAPSKLTPSRF